MTAAATARAARTRAGASPKTTSARATPRSPSRATGRSADVAPTASAEAAAEADPTAGARRTPRVTARPGEQRPSSRAPRVAALATSPEANQARERDVDLDAVDAAAAAAAPALIYGGARAWGPAGDADAALENAYDSVNLVRSDLIREFEARGVRLARLTLDFEDARAALVEAETRRALAESDSNKWRDAVSELERARDARARETREAQSRADADAETRVRRCATLEAALATANARLASAEEEASRLRARRDTETHLVDERGGARRENAEDAEDAAALAGRLAASAKDVAEARATAASSSAEAREARLECARSALRREELERRLEQTERALRDAEDLVSDAEAAVARARADAEASEMRVAEMRAGGDPSASAKDARIAELETALAALRGAAAQDAAALAAARKADVDEAVVVAAEERASAERARAERAEARLAALGAAAAAEEETRDRADAQAEQWRAALARVPGASSPAALADAVVRLEDELAAALGGGGEAAAAAAAAAATAAAATRRAEEAEEARLAAKSNEDELICALARAERKADALMREKESLRRVVKSYDDETSKHAAVGATRAQPNPSPSPSPSPSVSPFGAPPSAPETARREALDASLRDARERVSALEAELEAVSRDAAAARAALAEEKAASAAAAAAVAAAQARTETLERETRALERRLAAGGGGAGPNGPGASAVPGVGLGIVSLEKPLDRARTKVLHFKQNPEFAANETATARELASCRSECAALRETVAALSERDARGAPAPTPGETPRAPFGSLATPKGAGFGASTPMCATTPAGGVGTVVADAELVVARRRAADLEKRERRLMSAFQKQIYVFRESVRLLFGYKVDMSVDESGAGAHACVATLRSRFSDADDEDGASSVLRFAVEPARADGAAGAAAARDEGSVALLATPLAETEKVRRMADTFVGKCGSVPAFLANLTTELFNESEMRAR